jgi:hypothetical protein
VETTAIMVKLSKLWVKQDSIVAIEFNKPSQGDCLVTVITLHNGQWFTLSSQDSKYSNDIDVLKKVF